MRSTCHSVRLARERAEKLSVGSDAATPHSRPIVCRGVAVGPFDCDNHYYSAIWLAQQQVLL